MTAAVRSAVVAMHGRMLAGTVERVLDTHVEVRTSVGVLEAHNALATTWVPSEQDAVLVSCTETNAWFVTGVTRAKQGHAVHAEDGTRASLEQGVLTVRDARGALVFEHRPAERKSVVHAPHGDLELRADDGDISLVTEKGRVRIASHDAVELESETRVTMGVHSASEGPAPRLELSAQRASVSAPVIDARAVRAEGAFGEARLLAKTLSTVVETSRVVAGVIETQVTRAVTRAKNVFEEVEELAQTQAGRMRTIVRGTYHLFGKRAVLKADEDMKLKGQKIHLA